MLHPMAPPQKAARRARPPDAARRERILARERRRIAKLIDAHAPQGWQETYDSEALITAVEETTEVHMFVIAADIRHSTFLMKEAVDFGYFALTLDAFVSTAKAAVASTGGWFDKFTGDGFLAYWVIEDAPHQEYHSKFIETLTNMLLVADAVRSLFNIRVVPELRSNSRNMPDGLGLSMGLDAGPGYLVRMAGDLTIVGPPVVGAVRMVDAATEPNEILANVYVGSSLDHAKDNDLRDLSLGLTLERRPTKEGPVPSSGGN